MSDEPREGHAEPEPLVDAEPREVRDEPRFLAGDAEVGREREPEPAADRRPLDRRDHRLGAGEHPHRFDVEATRLLIEPLLAPLLPGAEVGAGTKMAALRAQHDGAAPRVGVEPLVDVRNLVDQVVVEEIVRWAMNLDGRDVAADLDGEVRADGCTGHRLPPLHGHDPCSWAGVPWTGVLRAGAQRR